MKATLLIRKIKGTDICYALVIDFDGNVKRYGCDEIEYAKNLLKTICGKADIVKFEEYEDRGEIEIGYMCEK